MYYVVLDIEMCKVPKIYRGDRYKYAREVIQIGAVLLDQDYKQVDTFSQYVKPEYGKIDNFIKNLTGINNFQVKEAPGLENALQNMLDWIGEREYCVYAWSENDYNQLKREIFYKGIDDPDIENFMDVERWHDYQAVFDERFDYDNKVGLKDALMLCDIDAVGNFHDGFYDALNTAILISRIETDPDFKLTKYEYIESYEPVNTCLGDLFGRMSLNIA